MVILDDGRWIGRYRARSLLLRLPALALFFMVVRSPLACATPENVGGTCDTTDDCFEGLNQQPIGSVCKRATGKCECPAGQKVCCETSKLPGYCAASCPGNCGVLEGGEGGPVAACQSDSDCKEKAPSPECGGSRCADGACVLVIEEGPVPSQLYGDCKRRECDEAGNLVEREYNSDFYNDGNECSIDYCDGPQPVNSVIPDGVSCPQSGEGYCYEGSCVECVQAMPSASCQGPDLVCTKFYCEPFSQCSAGQCGGVCAPCGIGGPCGTGADCISGSCKAGACALPSCSDGVKNDGETGVDCGSDSCGPCPDGSGCKEPADCMSGVCKVGKCQAPSCFDQTRNGGEEQIDCGGPCDPCP